MPKEQVIIIGGGPAGVACAIQLKRNGIDPLLLEKESIGGLLKNAWRIDNYPGFPDGIGGLEMAAKLLGHLNRFEIRYQKSAIQTTIYDEGIFLLKSGTKNFTCDYLVIATGTKAKHTAVKNSFTEVFPLREVTGKTIAIVGAGDAAFDYAMTLSSHNEVHIFNRGTKIKCIPALLEIAEKQKNISYHEKSMPGDSFDYTIFATGREPDLNCLSKE
jgi:thioredoxin reductase